MKMKLKVTGQASRLKKIRLYLGTSRKQLGKIIGISQFTLRSWENGAKNFTEEGVERFVTALKKKVKFSCDFDWLMHGTGPSPISLYEESKSLANESLSIDPLQDNLLKEIVLFKKSNPNVDVTIVSDNRFYPVATEGDYIGLLPIKISKIKEDIEKIIFMILKDKSSRFGVLLKKESKKTECAVMHLGANGVSSIPKKRN